MSLQKLAEEESGQAPTPDTAVEEVLPEDAEARLNNTLQRIDQPEVREAVRQAVIETVEVAVETTLYHRGPLPPPGQIVDYGKALPGLDRQIADMALAEQTHRHTMTAKTGSQEFVLNLVGLGAILLALLMMLAVVAYMVAQGAAGAGAALGGAIIVGVVVALSNYRKSAPTPMPKERSNSKQIEAKGSKATDD